MKIGIILVCFFTIGYLYFYNRDINKKTEKRIDDVIRIMTLEGAMHDRVKLKKVIKKLYGYDYEAPAVSVYSTEQLKKAVVSYDELLFITHSEKGVIKSFYILNTLTGETIELTSNKVVPK